MAFVLTLFYVAITLVSPGVFPEWISSLHISEIFGVLVILTAVWEIGGSKLVSRPETYLGLGLLLASIASMLTTGWFGGTITVFLDFAPIWITFFFITITCSNLLRLKILVSVMTLVGLFILSQGAIADYTGNILSKYLLQEKLNDLTIIYRYRGLGALADPNDLAQFLVMVIPLLWLRWKKSHLVSNFFLTLLPAGLLATGVYFTHSRGGAIALIAVLLFGFKDKLGLIGSSILASVSMVGLLALNVAGGRGMGEDDGGRVALWGEGLQTLKAHPILGIGPGNFINFSSNGKTAHNSFILAMVELGVVGYFFWLGMIVSSWSGLSQMIRSHLSKAAAERKSRAGSRMYPSRRERILSTVSQLVEAPAGIVTHSVAKPAPQLATAAPGNLGTWSPSPTLQLYRQDFADDEHPSAEQLAYAARIIRISFVGLLTAGFFLSRTYAVSLYITLGMAVSVIKMSVPLPTVNILSLVKKITLACFVSLLFLYLFVRLHGAR